MDAAVPEAGVRTVVGFVLRWNPLALAAKAMLAEGLFGEPIFVQTDYWHNGEVSGYPGAKGRLWRATIDAMLGGGCHAVDLARYLMGSDVVEVVALETTALEGLPKPANQVALVRFANGKAGKVSAMHRAVDSVPVQRRPARHATAVCATIASTAESCPGMLDWATFPTILPNSGLVEHHPFQGEVDHFVECIREGMESHVSLRDAVNTHEACFAVSESAQNGGRPVRVTSR